MMLNARLIYLLFPMKNIYRIFLIIFVSIFIISCGSRKSVPTKPKPSYSSENLRNLNSKYIGKNSSAVNRILSDAEDFLGTPYRFGGTTKSGLDCSGLVITVYDENNVKLPRRSSDQALEGKKIDISEAKPGDLLFFSTSGNGKVSHVGIVKEIKTKGEITFIHASTSKGVIISSLNEKYWNKAFLFARRVL